MTYITEASDLASQAYKYGKLVGQKIIDGFPCDLAIIELSDTVDSIVDEWKQVDVPLKIDCRDGCDHCCHMRVVVTVPEVISVKNHILNNFSQHQQQIIVDKLLVSANSAEGLDDETYGQTGIWCPLLTEKSCSVHKARPLECRGYVSQDVNVCIKTKGNYIGWDVPIYKPQYQLYKHAQAGLVSRLRDSKHDSSLLEFNKALLIAFQNKDSEELWRKGEAIFVEAALPKNDEEVQAMQPWTSTFF